MSQTSTGEVAQITRVHSSAMTIELTLPVIDLDAFFGQNTEAFAKECKKVAEAFHQYGALVVKDPRVTFQDNERFLTMMENYFNQTTEAKLKDARPEYAYQVGVTPELTETPRCTFDESCLELVEKLSEDNKPHLPSGPDPKWRYFWRIGERPVDTRFKGLNADEVVPEAFPEWTSVMNTWGNLMLSAVTTIAEMAAVGFGMEKDAFTSLMKNGPHLLAPTGSDLGKYQNLDTIFAGFHYDLNFLTIHGKSRFPGLFIWARTGEKVQVRVPDGCLLVQAGKQMEWLTGGHVLAGYHEVVVLPETLKAVELARSNNRPLWRVSSTLFSHIASDNVLKPLVPFDKEACDAYPPMKAGEQVQKELESINLKK